MSRGQATPRRLKAAIDAVRSTASNARTSPTEPNEVSSPITESLIGAASAGSPVHQAARVQRVVGNRQPEEAMDRDEREETEQEYPDRERRRYAGQRRGDAERKRDGHAGGRDRECDDAVAPSCTPYRGGIECAAQDDMNTNAPAGATVMVMIMPASAKDGPSHARTTVLPNRISWGEIRSARWMAAVAAAARSDGRPRNPSRRDG